MPAVQPLVARGRSLHPAKHGEHGTRKDHSDMEHKLHCNKRTVAMVASVENAGKHTDKTSIGLKVDIVRSIRAFLTRAGPTPISRSPCRHSRSHLPGCREVNLFVRQHAANKHHGSKQQP